MAERFGQFLVKDGIVDAAAVLEALNLQKKEVSLSARSHFWKECFPSTRSLRFSMPRLALPSCLESLQLKKAF